MTLRLVITMTAAPGKSDELAARLRERNAGVLNEPGCEQFEIFKNMQNPDELVLLEIWKDQASLDAHVEVNKTRPVLPDGLRLARHREDYVYNRVK